MTRPKKINAKIRWSSTIGVKRTGVTKYCLDIRDVERVMVNGRSELISISFDGLDIVNLSAILTAMQHAVKIDKEFINNHAERFGV